MFIKSKYISKKIFLSIAFVSFSLFLSGCFENKPQESVLRVAEEHNIKGLAERQPADQGSADKLTVQTPGGGSQQPAESQNQPVSPTNSKQPPPMQIDQNKTYSAILKTSEGEITIELDAKKTPITVNNFVALAREKFYDGLIFHRVVKDFMIQSGDPNGDGSGGPGYKFADEPFDGEYVRGTVAMANSGPNTNGSQFFIIHKDYALPKNYVIFGHVSAGLETLDKIADAETVANGAGEKSKPVNPVKIESVEVVEK
jgi:cyclophilin family peptidyl-prolyl cis-trans isomerase